MKALGTVLITLLLLAGASPRAGADGGFITNLDPIVEPEQLALIVHDQGWQDLVLQVRFRGEPEDFAWLVPVPAAPTILPALPDIFGRLQAFTVGLSPGESGMNDNGRSPSGFLVTETPPADLFGHRILAPGDDAAWRQWFEERGLRLTDRQRGTIDDYRARGWWFVAMTIAADRPTAGDLAGIAEGITLPLHLRYRADEPVFALQISSINPGSSRVVIYLAAGERSVPRTARNVHWSSRVVVALPDLARDPGFDPVRLRGLGLTRLVATFSSEEMTEDVYFRRYEPAEGLGSNDAWEQVDAATMIGMERRPERLAALVAFFDSDQATDRGIRSAIWALGQMNSSAAVPPLLAVARSRVGAHQAEAVQSLMRLHNSASVVALIELLTGWTEAPDAGAPMVDEVARYLARLPSDRVIGPLRSVLRAAGTPRRRGRLAWNTLVDGSGSRLDLVVLGAIHGDRDARRALVAQIVREGKTLAVRPPLPEQPEAIVTLVQMTDAVFRPAPRLRARWPELEDWPALRAALVILDDLNLAQRRLVDLALHDGQLSPPAREWLEFLRGRLTPVRAPGQPRSGPSNAELVSIPIESEYLANH